MKLAKEKKQKSGGAGSILVTGSAGFIGFHLCKRLLDGGWNVVGIDNYSNYYDVGLKRDRERILKEYKNFSEKEVDISDYQALKRIFSENKFDKVMNLAAQAGVRYSLSNPFAYENANNKGFLNILEACRNFGVKDLVYASSSSVYGANKKIPFREEDKTESPVSLYGATKKYNELAAYSYSSLYGINTTGLRFFTVYGPYGRPDMAIFLFTKAVLDGKEIELFNKGNMERDFTYIDDVVDGIVAAINNPFLCEVFNLGRGNPINLMEFIKVIEEVAGVKAKIRMLPMQAGDVEKTFADTSKARKMLAYEPKVEVGEGVTKFVKWYVDYYKVRKRK